MLTAISALSTPPSQAERSTSQPLPTERAKAPVAESSTPTAPVSADKAPAASTVSISAGAQAALKEATETTAQTQHEAAAGDRVAQKLLAKQEAKQG